MKRFLCVVCMVLITFVIFAQDDKVVKTATVPYPPYFMEDVNTGLWVDILREIFKTQGYTVVVENLPWARAVEYCKSGKIDFISVSSVEPEHIEVEYSDNEVVPGDPVCKVKIGLLGLKTNQIDFNDQSDLKPYIFVQLRGEGFNEAFTELEWFEVDSYIQGGRMITGGRAHFLVNDFVMFASLLQTTLKEYKSVFKIVETPLLEYRAGDIFSKNAPDYEVKLAAYNKGLSIIKKNNKLKMILTKYKMNKVIEIAE